MFKIKYFFLFSALALTLSNCQFSNNNSNTNPTQNGGDDNNPSTNSPADSGFTVTNATECYRISEGSSQKFFLLSYQNNVFPLAIVSEGLDCNWNTLNKVIIQNKIDNSQNDEGLSPATEEDKANIYLVMNQFKQDMQKQIIQNDATLKQQNIIKRNILDVFQYINGLGRNINNQEIFQFQNQYSANIIANRSDLTMKAGSNLIGNLNLTIENNNQNSPFPEQ